MIIPWSLGYQLLWVALLVYPGSNIVSSQLLQDAHNAVMAELPALDKFMAQVVFQNATGRQDMQFAKTHGLGYRRIGINPVPDHMDMLMATVLMDYGHP